MNVSTFAAPQVLPLRSHDPKQRGPWRLIGRIGAGGMGTVYLAHHATTGQIAALKVMSDALADQPGFRERFAREIRILQQVTGPFVAAVIDGDAHAELPWIATEYVPGPDLARLVREHGPLDEGSWTGLAVGLLSALTRIHAAGIVHRDLKPANILLSADGPKVIDFGVAQLLDATALTSTGTALGTPGWLAPEQIRGSAASPATDAFSAGAVLAYAATGRAPFGGDTTPAAAMHAVLNDTPDLTGVTGDQRTLLDGLLDKNPDTRWSPSQATAHLAGDDTPADEYASRIWSNSEVTQRLSEPTRIGIPDTGQRVQPRRRRRWIVWTPLAVLAASLVGGLMLTPNIDSLRGPWNGQTDEVAASPQPSPSSNASASRTPEAAERATPTPTQTQEAANPIPEGVTYLETEGESPSRQAVQRVGSTVRYFFWPSAGRSYCFVGKYEDGRLIGLQKTTALLDRKGRIVSDDPANKVRTEVLIGPRTWVYDPASDYPFTMHVVEQNPLGEEMLEYLQSCTSKI